MSLQNKKYISSPIVCFFSKLPPPTHCCANNFLLIYFCYKMANVNASKQNAQKNTTFVFYLK